MPIEPVIKSYLPLDDDSETPDSKEERIVEKEGDSKEPFSLEDERAFAVGLTTIIVVVGLLVIFGVWYFVTHNQAAEVSTNESMSDQPGEKVLGESIEPDQNTIPTDSEQTVGTETETTSTFPGGVYTVESGDTLYSIGLKLKVDWKEIAQLNNLESPYNLKKGQELQIPQ
ncbi:MAG TPA: LysM peptidoglycan-binding domain-containing protein [Patescibacteria group bacterium]|nr:LysM peptidoglycan-binding domain-containing protein [Patescibacteria group bacterium]